ncbi:hypothetical protein [Mycobacterium sp. PSTR-4-N]|uniref:hypothetical protein n=1 Tax=Mycobacterium sp. PSTR-4-N TaxID=2917745 RepID=UPI001F1547DB|nr:hypothetical protein [Mycobacterium sp. PSTR-4-N]MCG7597832.1 hypothetical protein [Mycobacterium sp. PSTR-4-N]
MAAAGVNPVGHTGQGLSTTGASYAESEHLRRAATRTPTRDRTTLPPDHPHRFGWRFWIMLPEHARLLTPHGHPGGAMSTHSLAEATCTHGNTPPAQDCPCGIYYMPNLSMFRAFCGSILNRTEPARLDPDRWLDLGLSIPFLAALQGTFDDEPPGPLEVSYALTFGAAVGDVALGYHHHYEPGTLRAHRYRTLAIVVPLANAELHSRLKAQYRCPVLADVNTCDAIEHAITADPTVRADLDALADETASPPDALATRWNARLVEKALTPLNVPPALLPEHVRGMLHTRFAAQHADWRPPAELC